MELYYGNKEINEEIRNIYKNILIIWKKEMNKIENYIGERENDKI